MTLLPAPVLQLEDLLGLPRAFAEAYFTLTGTTTPTTVFSDADLAVPISQPVTADDEGIFPTVFYDPTIQIRLRIIEEDGDLGTPLIDIDPLNDLLTGTIEATHLVDGAIEEKLGYTPLADDGSVSSTGIQVYDFTTPPTELDEVMFGYMGAPASVKNADYTLVLTDSGKMIGKSSTATPTWTIPPDVDVDIPIGHGCWMVNYGASGSVTIARGAAVALTEAGDTTNEDKTLVAGGMVFVRKIAANTWKTVGAGV